MDECLIRPGLLSRSSYAWDRFFDALDVIEQVVGATKESVWAVPKDHLGMVVSSHNICLFAARVISSGPVSNTQRVTESWREERDVIGSILQNTTMGSAECFRLQQDFVFVLEKLHSVVVGGFEDNVQRVLGSNGIPITNLVTHARQRVMSVDSVPRFFRVDNFRRHQVSSQFIDETASTKVVIVLRLRERIRISRRPGIQVRNDRHFYPVFSALYVVLIMNGKLVYMQLMKKLLRRYVQVSRLQPCLEQCKFNTNSE